MLITWLESVCTAIEKIAAILLAAITVLIAVSAVGRYVFAAPLPDSFDIARLLLGAAVMWGFASLGYRGSHIEVTLFTDLLPPRARRAVELFAWAVVLAFVALLAWKMLARVESAARSGEATFDLRLPVWPLMALIWAGAAAAVVTVLARLALIWTGRHEAAGIPPADGHRE